MVKEAARDNSEVKAGFSGLAVGDPDLVSERVALITGYTGQDGTFLTRLLLQKGYQVIGLVRRISSEPPRRVRGNFDFSKELSNGQLILHEGDLLSVDSLIDAVQEYEPAEIYNLGAQSHVGVSFKQPELTLEANLMGTVNLITALESVENYIPDYNWKMYQASTSEMFGDRRSDTRLNEDSPLQPVSPYAIAKAAAHSYCQMKRAQGRFISCGILFNHESEIRGGDFVTQKIARGVRHWQQTGEAIALGNMESGRDWGYAGDYVEAMWLMLQQEQADDYVVATGTTHTVRAFVEEAFAAIGQEIRWSEGDRLIGYVNGQPAVVTSAEFYRPNEVGYLNGDASKMRALGWQPKTSFKELVKRMVEAAK